jgi:hypothetical protein
MLLVPLFFLACDNRKHGSTAASLKNVTHTFVNPKNVLAKCGPLAIHAPGLQLVLLEDAN